MEDGRYKRHLFHFELKPFVVLAPQSNSVFPANKIKCNRQQLKSTVNLWFEKCNTRQASLVKRGQYYILHQELS